MDQRKIERLIGSFSISFCCRCDADFSIIYGADTLASWLGYPDTSSSVGLFSFVSAESRDELLGQLDLQMERGDEIEFTMTLFCADSSERFVHLRARCCYEDDASYLCGIILESTGLHDTFTHYDNELLTFRRKLTRTEGLISRLQIQAEQDSLTKVFNANTVRKLSQKYLEEEGGCCALLIIDVDNFKHVNDTYGHMTGDEVLIKTAALIRKLFRAGDIIGRVGGDEFFVLMKDIPGSEIAIYRCDQIVKAVNKIRCCDRPDSAISCSVGVSFACGQTDYNTLFCNADRALYQAKGLGGNCYFVATE